MTVKQVIRYEVHCDYPTCVRNALSRLTEAQAIDVALDQTDYMEINGRHYCAKHWEYSGDEYVPVKYTPEGMTL